MINDGVRKMTRVFLSGKSSFRFTVGVIAGLSFSIAVILSTVGIMDGFDESLRKGLKKSNGDIVVYSVNGFFKNDKNLEQMQHKFSIEEYAPILQIEAFTIFGEQSKGVLVKGVNAQEFSAVTGIKLTIGGERIAIGHELAKYLGAKVGDELVLAFANGNRDFQGMPLLSRFKISQIIKHGIYLKDVRLIYADRTFIQGILKFGDKINLISLNVPKNVEAATLAERIRKFKFDLEDYLDLEFGVRPYWQEYSGLLEAVKVQKLVIAIILQLIVIISVFNVFAFLIFLNEKKSKDIFLFKSLGLSQKMLVRSWTFLVLGLWAFSCLCSVFLVQIFDLMLRKLPILKLPGNIYHLGELSVKLTLADYLWVFMLALVWIGLISMFVFYRLRRRSILQGLRKEFA